MRTTARRWAAVALLVGTAVAPGGSQTPTDFTIALTGDSIITRRLSVYTEPAFTRLIELVRGADAAFTNIEMLFHDFEPYPMNESGGTYMRAEPALAKELAWAGFDLGSLANNHTGDYGALGMRLTKKYVAEAGIVAAGSGESLPEAREAKFLETPKGRIALISVASTFPDHSRAGRTRGDVPARPGLSPLRFTTTYVVTKERFEQLRLAAGELTGQTPAAGDSLTLRRAPLRRRRDPGDPHRAAEGGCRRDRGGGEERGHARRPGHRHHPRPRGRAHAARAGRVPGHLRPRDDRRRRRPVRRPRPARAARRRDLQGRADPLQPRRLHLPERDAAALSGRQLRRTAARSRGHARTTTSTAATTSTSRASRPIPRSGSRWWRCRASGPDDSPSWRSTRSRSVTAARARCAAGRCWRRPSWDGRS